MNKLLITEINRIQELMGKPLITEITIPKKLIEELIGKFGIKMSKTVNDLLTSLKNAKKNDEIANIIAKLANEDESLAKLITPKVIANLPIESRNNIEAVKDYFDELLKKRVPVSDEEKRRTIDAFMKNNVKTELKGVNDIIRKELTDYVDDLFPSKPATNVTPLPKKPTTITDVVGQQWENIKPLSNEEILELERAYKKKGLGKSFFYTLRFFGRTVVDMISKQYELMDETLSLIKTLTIETNPAKKVDIQKRISENLKTLTQRDSDNFLIIDEWIDTNIGNYKIKSKIKGLDGYSKAAALLDSESLRKWKESYKGLLERRSALRTQINSVFNPLSWLKRSNMEKWGEGKDSITKLWWNKWGKMWSGDDFSEMRAWLVSFQTRNTKQLQEFAEKNGLPKTVISAGKEVIIGYVMLVATYALLDFITDLISNLLLDFEYFRQFEVIQRQLAGWDTKVSRGQLDVETNWEKGGLYILHSSINYWLDELDKISFWPPVATISKSLLELSNFMFTSQLTEETLLMTKDKANEIKVETKTQIDKIADTTQNVATNIVDNIKDSEPGFRRWCQTNGKVFVRYDEGIGTTVEDGKEKYWYFDTDENTFKENKPE
jgi:hypothetical protein